MRIQDLITYVRSLVEFAYYPNTFPTTAADECAIVTIHQGMGADQYTGIKYPSFQILVRGKPRDFQHTEEKAYEIFEAIANKTNQQIGGDSVVVIKPQGSAPFFIGLDETDRPIYSMNFDMVIRP